MSLKQFLCLIGGTAVFSWMAWGVVLFQVDPEVAGRAGLAVFYSSLSIALVGTFTVLGLALRVIWHRIRKQETIAFKYIAQTIRQAVWFSAVIVVSLMLSAANLFTWWSSGTLLIGFIILEGFFLTHDNLPERHTTSTSD